MERKWKIIAWGCAIAFNSLHRFVTDNRFLINARFHSTIEFIVRIPIEFDSWFEHFNNSSTIVVNRILGRGYDPRVCDWAKLNGISFESVTPTKKEPTLGRTTLSLVFDKINTDVQITPSKFFFFLWSFFYYNLNCFTALNLFKFSVCRVESFLQSFALLTPYQGLYADHAST